MSDLAPLVVATIRDKVVLDLQKENEDLRDELKNGHNQVKVTGANGIPCYAKAHIDSAMVAITQNGELRTRTLTFEENEPSHRPMTAVEFENAEIYIGLQKERLALGEWEMGALTRMQQDENGRTVFLFHLRDWKEEYKYPELMLEVAYQTDPGTRLNTRPNGIRGLFPPGFVPTVKFVDMELHEPSEATLARLRDYL